MANAKKKSFEALGFLIDGERTIQPGETIELTESQAERLLEAEVVKEIEVEEKKK